MAQDAGSLVRLLAYVGLLTLGVVSTTIGLHELGHLWLGQALGCSPGRIVLYDPASAGPYTELSCASSPGLLGLTGFPFPLLFALLFFTLRVPERELGWMALGLAIMLGGLDVLLLAPLPLLTPALALAGGGLILWGQSRLLGAFLDLPPGALRRIRLMG